MVILCVLINENRMLLEEAIQLYQTYEIIISDKQKKLITILFINYYYGGFSDDLDIETVEFDLNEYIKKHLENNTKTIHNLTSRDLKMFEFLKKDTRLNKLQIDFLKEKLSIDKISTILQREIKTYEEITLFDFNSLLLHPSVSIFRLISNIAPVKHFFITEYSTDYEIGFTYLSHKTKNCFIKYIKFYNLFVLDYDLNKDQTKESLLKKIKESLDIRFSYKIYETYNGYHVFLLSCPIQHNSKYMLNLASAFKSDPFYILYTHYYGYSIRISHKIGRNENDWNQNTHKFVCDYGSENIDQYCLKLINIFEKNLNDNINKGDYSDLKINDILKYDIKSESESGSESGSESYYTYFIKKFNQKNSLELTEPNRIKFDFSFKDYLLQKNGKTYNMISLLDSIFLGNITKPHRYLSGNNDYFLAIDVLKNMYCIYYKNLMVIDIDYKNEENKENKEKNEENKEKMNQIDREKNVLEITEKMNKITGDSYIIYSTNSGFHIFVTNRKFEHSSEESCNYMLNFGCDFNYIMATYSVGWCIRLNRKNEEDKMYNFFCTIGDNFTYKNLVDLHITYSDKFKHNLVKKITKL